VYDAPVSTYKTVITLNSKGERGRWIMGIFRHPRGWGYINRCLAREPVEF